MKKMKLVLAVSLILSLLCGCVGSIGEVTVNKDGSGSATLSLGYTEDVINSINEMAENEEEKMQLSDLTKFSHNGVDYYGQVFSFTFEDPAELAETLNLYQDVDNNSVDTGLFAFEAEDDLVMRLTASETTGAVGDTSGEEADEETAAMLEQAAVVYTFEFFDAVTQTEGRECDAISIDGNKLTVDYIALSEALQGESETFAFSVPNAEIPSAVSASFPDVKQGDWFYDNVISMANGGMINGRASGLFCPQDTMTRAEFTAIAVRAVIGEAGENLLTGEASPCWDKYYTSAVEGGLLSEEQFPYDGMDIAMTREEMAEVAYRMLCLVAGTPDVDLDAAAGIIPDWDQVDEQYQEAVAYCYAAEILNGMDDAGTFAPKASMTRAQASTVIARVLEQIVE